MRTSNPLPKVRASYILLFVRTPVLDRTPASGTPCFILCRVGCPSELEFTRRSVPIGEALALVLDLFISEFHDPSAIVLESHDHLKRGLSLSGMIMLALSLDIPFWARVRIRTTLAEQSLLSYQHHLQGHGHKLRQEITRHPHP